MNTSVMMLAAMERPPEKFTNLHVTDPSPPEIQVWPAYKNLTSEGIIKRETRRSPMAMLTIRKLKVLFILL